MELALSGPSAVIWLDPLRVGHAEGMFTGLSDAAAYVYLPDDPPINVEWLRDRYRHQTVGHSSDGSELWFNWIIRRDDGTFLGYTQATVVAREALVAYHLFPQHWRQGIGSKALAATLDAVFGMAGVTLARALVDTRNEASRRLLASLGFVAVRMIEQADFFKGCVSDEIVFELQNPIVHSR